MNLQREQGFTIMELVVVIIIIGLLAAFVAPKFFGKVSEAKQKAAKAQIELFGTALDALPLDVGRYPTTDEGLKALREKPSGMEFWKGPYLPKEIPMDPWGKPYVYKSPGDYGIMTSSLMDSMEPQGEREKMRMWLVGRVWEGPRQQRKIIPWGRGSDHC